MEKGVVPVFSSLAQEVPVREEDGMEEEEEEKGEVPHTSKTSLIIVSPGWNAELCCGSLSPEMGDTCRSANSANCWFTDLPDINLPEVFEGMFHKTRRLETIDYRKKIDALPEISIPVICRLAGNFHFWKIAGLPICRNFSFLRNCGFAEIAENLKNDDFAVCQKCLILTSAEFADSPGKKKLYFGKF
nr:hypothetical protein H19M22.4 - Caenorhabditis elegans [Caenorhabditis elegans]